MPRIAEINLTQGQKFFQKEEGDISALLSELEEGVSVMHGDEDEDCQRPHPVPLRRLVEEAVTRRQATRRETHLTWVTTDVILLLTVQFLMVSNFVYHGVRGAWRNLISRRRTNSAPATRPGEQTHPGTSAAFHNRQAERVDNPPDARILISAVTSPQHPSSVLVWHATTRQQRVRARRRYTMRMGK